MMGSSAGRQISRLYRMILSILVVGVLVSYRSVHGDASQHQHQQQVEATIEASGEMKFSSSQAPVEAIEVVKAAEVVEAVEPAAEVVEAVEPAAKAVEAVKPAAKAIEAVEPAAKAVEAVEPAAKAIETVEPTAKAVEAVEPAAKAVETVEPAAKAVEAVEPVAKAVEAVEPATKAVEAIEPVAKAVEAVEPATKAVEAIEPASEAVEEVSVGPADDGGGACADPSLTEKELEGLKTELAAAEERLLALQKEADLRQAKHLAELGSCGAEKDTLRQEVETAKGEVGQLAEVLEKAGGGEGIKTLAEKAAAADATKKEKEGAVTLAAELETQLKSELDAAHAEIGDLRSKLSGAEASAVKAQEEAGKYAGDKDEALLKLERTASELEIAKKPRHVSIAAILADVRQLFDDLMRQSADARDDLVSRGSVELKKAIELIQPYWKITVEVVSPVVEEAMVATAPQRAMVVEACAEYWKKIDDAVDAVRKPATQKLSEVVTEISKAAHEAWEKWQVFELDLQRHLIGAGLSKDEADKACKYTYFLMMATTAVILLFYLTKPVLCYVVIPLVRTVLRLALWLICLPLRILLVWPVMLVLWVLTRSFRLAFGGKGKKGKKSPTSSKAKARTPNAKATTGGGSAKKKR